MAIVNKLQVFDEQGNQVDYDILASDVKFSPDGKDLPTKLTEMEDAIEEAGSGDGTVTGVKVGSTPYNPDSNGVVDLSVPFAEKATKTELQNAINSLQSALDTLIGSGNVQGAIDTFNEVKAFLDGIDTDDPTLFNQLKSLSDAITALQNTLSQKANDNAVVKSISVNGTAQPKDTNGNVNIEVQGGGLSKEDISVETQGDGTVDINVADDTYTINLNHTHEGMVKLEKYTEATMPQTKADDIIYVQVDDVTTPQAIDALYIFGLEFTGGGAAPGTPAITKPSVTTINLGENDGSGVSKTIEIRANSHITGDLTVGLAANSNLSFDTTNLPSGVTYNSGAGTLTIAQATAMQGVNITIVYSGSGGAEIDGGIVISGGGATPKSVVVVVEAFPSELVQDTAWCAASGENFSAPETQAGYCTTPFYQLTHDSSGKLDYIIKAGYVTPTNLARGMFVTKTNLTDTQTLSAFLQSSDPRRKQLADTKNLNNYLSATFKTSEWADCYIYDYIAGAYLFAGANVDTSTPPTMINPT